MDKNFFKNINADEVDADFCKMAKEYKMKKELEDSKHQLPKDQKDELLSLYRTASADIKKLLESMLKYNTDKDEQYQLMGTGFIEMKIKDMNDIITKIDNNDYANCPLIDLFSELAMEYSFHW